MKTLKNRLAKKVEACYLVQGDDVILFDKALELIKQAANLQFEDFNFIVFDEENFSEDVALESCETLPMGSDKKVVLFKNITKISADFKKKLQTYMKKPVESTCIVIFDFAAKWDFLICEKVSANRLDQNSLVALITAEVKKFNKTITQDAAQLLIEYCCSFFSLISNELQKLCSTDATEICADDVSNLVCKETEFTVFELTDALSKRDASRSVNLLNLMEKDTKTFSLILNHFRRVFFASTSDLTDKEIAELLSVKEYAVIKARSVSRYFTKIQLKNIYEMLNDVDFYIKNGQMTVENALYYIVFFIVFVK